MRGLQPEVGAPNPFATIHGLWKGRPMSDVPPIIEAETVVRCKACGRDLPVSARDGECPACVRQALFEATIAGEPPPRFAAPTVAQLDRWLPSCEVLEVAGSGGMGYVYKARQVALDRLVAIKVLPIPGAATGKGSGSFLADQFLLEARAMARLNHPHIVAIHDFGSTGDGYFYFIMEYVDGVGLDEFVRVTRPSVLEALRLLVPICDALAYAHREGIVHRDIKPANILIGARGQVKVADFGIASLAGAGEDGPVLGTPGFMAPEQEMEGRPVDGRADIYSLGVLIFDMMTGEMPKRKRRSVAASGGVSVRLDGVLARALETDPERRFSSAEEMKEAIEDVIRHQELMTGGVLPWRRDSGRAARAAARWIGRLAWLCVIALMGTAALLGVRKWQGRDASADPVVERDSTFRRFVNRGGAAFEGEAVSHFGNVVRIRDREGKIWAVPMESLSNADQEWARQWKIHHPASPEAGDVNLDARRPFGTGLQRVPDARYEILVGNATDSLVAGLVLEYKVFFEAEGMTRFSERVAVDGLKAGETRVVPTRRVDLPRVRPEKPGVKPKVLGLWARVSVAGKIIAEYRESGLMTEGWDAGGGR
jgi:hypothetical protein